MYKPNKNFNVTESIKKKTKKVVFPFAEMISELKENTLSLVLKSLKG